MNKIIADLEAILSGDKWYIRERLAEYVLLLKEKRDAALKAKEETPPINEDDSVAPRTPEEMIKDGLEAVKEFDSI